MNMMVEEHLRAMVDNIIGHTLKNLNNRKIVIWGKYHISEVISKELSELYNIETAFYIDSNTQKQDCLDIFPPEILNGMSKNYFIIIPLPYYQCIKDKLADYLYEPKKDYYYFSDCIVKHDDFYYEDLHGNKVIGFHNGFKFTFYGFNNTVIIGKQTIANNAIVYMYGDSEIHIGNKCNISNSTLFVGSNVNLNLGNNGIIYSLNACVGDKAKLEIDNNFSIASNGRFSVSDNTSLIIGSDCMFSYDVYLYSNDAHSIFDVVSGNNINSSEDINKQRKIVIGNHVWIGMKSTILYNTEIGDGSIIGANSLVKTKIPNNCIAVGNPAKVVRKNISWSRNNCADNIIDCGKEYINLTGDE